MMTYRAPAKGSWWYMCVCVGGWVPSLCGVAMLHWLDIMFSLCVSEQSCAVLLVSLVMTSMNRTVRPLSSMRHRRADPSTDVAASH